MNHLYDVYTECFRYKYDFFRGQKILYIQARIRYINGKVKQEEISSNKDGQYNK